MVKFQDAYRLVVHSQDQFFIQLVCIFVIQLKELIFKLVL